MKPHEETWEATQASGGDWYITRNGKKGRVELATFHAGAEYEAKLNAEGYAKLATCSPEMARWLLDFLETGDGCHWEHKSDELTALLKKAGVL